jgi:hypothetical protein
MQDFCAIPLPFLMQRVDFALAFQIQPDHDGRLVPEMFANGSVRQKDSASALRDPCDTAALSR